MKLHPNAHEILLSMYNRYIDTGDMQEQINYSSDPLKKKAQVAAVNALLAANYVTQSIASCSFTKLQLTRDGIDYFDSPVQASVSQITYNFSGSIQNSIVGSQASAALNVNADISEIKSLIQSVQESDRATLSSLLETLETLKEKKELPRGFLAKFNKVLSDYPKICDSVSSFLMKFVLNACL